MPTLTATQYPTEAYVFVEADWSDITDAYIPGGLNLPGVSGDYAYSPDQGAYDITGDIDLRAYVTTDWTPVADDACLVAKADSTGNQRSYFLRIETTGELSLFWSEDGISFLSSTSTVAVTPPASNRLAVRATLDVDDGSGNRVVTFYTAPDMEGVWTLLGAPVVTAATTSIFSSTALIEIGLRDQTGDLFVGTIHSVQIRNGIDGEVVAFPRFDEQPSETTQFTDDIGHVWNVAGNAYISAASNPEPSHVTAYRVDDTTGERTQLRGYICVDENGCLPLSCDGLAAWWDTEAPVNTDVHYETELCPGYELCTVEDSFTRVEADTWGDADTGQTWDTSAFGVAADYDVDGAHGTMLVSTAAVNERRSAFVDTGLVDMDVTADFIVPAVATGADYLAYVFARATDASNGYYVRISFQTNGDAVASIARFVAGSSTLLTSSINLGPYVAGERYRMMIRVLNDSVFGKAWRPATESEPDWLLKATDTTFTTGTLAGLSVLVNSGNTNVPLVAMFDNFLACASCVDPTEVTASSTTVNIAATSEQGWLKHPTQPCLDLQIGNCDYPEGCPDGNDAISYGGTFNDRYPANTAILEPVNRKWPVPISRQRRDASATFLLITSTCADREAVLAINDPGDPLLLQVDDQYCLPDRYVSVGDLGEDRFGVDQRVENRLFAHPYVTVERTLGPMAGPCGTQFGDICDIHATWDDVETAGLSSLDILRGDASPDSPQAN